MKKSIFLPLLLCLLPLASCGNTPANMEEVNKLKALLAKQDLSPAYQKMFVNTFIQNYSFYSSSHGQEESETSFYTYRGGGIFGCFYDVSEAAYREVEALENHDFFDYLARGTGSYGMLQTASLVSYLYKGEGEEPAESLWSMNFLQRLESYFDDKDVQIYNVLAFNEGVEAVYDHTQSFNGRIDKKTLFDAITVRAFSDIFARANLFDGQRTCEAIDRLYYDVVGLLGDKSDQELSDFIGDNAIRIEEGAASTLVHFRIDEGGLRAILGDTEVIPGGIEGTLTYEKETGAFDAFDYKIVYVGSEADGNDVRSTSLEFSANGYSQNKKYDRDLYVKPDPMVYEDAETFLDDVVKEVIPPFF